MILPRMSCEKLFFLQWWSDVRGFDIFHGEETGSTSSTHLLLLGVVGLRLGPTLYRTGGGCHVWNVSVP